MGSTRSPFDVRDLYLEFIKYLNEKCIPGTWGWGEPGTYDVYFNLFLHRIKPRMWIRVVRPEIARIASESAAVLGESKYDSAKQQITCRIEWL